MRHVAPQPEAPVPYRLAIRRLMRSCAKAALATSMESGHGWPYASLVTVATAQDGSPILLLSGLSDHTRNIEADSRVSLLFDGSEGYANPQQGPRVTMLGRARRTADPACRTRFLARHPAAHLYAGFGDFAFWRVEMERAHYVGGFARALWIEDRLGTDAVAAQQMAEAESGILGHMNEDHPATIDLYARALLGQPGTGWRLAGIDSDGCDLVRDETFARLHFDQPVDGPEAARAALMELAERARNAVPAAGGG
jgi:putative heme iron utilization protein